MTTQPSDLLGHMVDNMTSENWWQGSLMNGNRRKRCMMGHLELAQVQYNALAGSSIAWRACDRLLAAIAVFTDSDRSSIDGFNDNHHTTFEDISLVVKQAYVNALEEDTQ